MAADKGESGSVQSADAAKQTKKPTAAQKKKNVSLSEKTVSEAKAAYKDIDLSEGRKLRKRPASAPLSVPKKSAPKKAATKKAGVSIKRADKKTTKASAAKGE